MLAEATRADPADVALRFGLGHLSPLEDAHRWATSSPITRISTTTIS